MRDNGLISWPALSRDYIDDGIPFEQVSAQVPELRVIFEPVEGLLGMRIQIDSSTRWARSDGLRYLATRRIVLEGIHYLEASVASRYLDIPMYQLICDVNSRIVAGQTDGASALQSALNGFEMVVAKLTQPARETVIGLIGELWVLKGLLRAGRVTLDAWTGPNREIHDFRLAGFELEVKTTTANSRIHTIHGLNQLRPSVGNILQIVSVQLGAAGLSEGFSLADLISDVRAELSSSSGALAEFTRKIDTFDVSVASGECSIKYKLISLPMAIEMGKDIQGVSSVDLAVLLGVDVSARMHDLQFKLNMDGLGIAYDPRKYGERDE